MISEYYDSVTNLLCETCYGLPIPNMNFYSKLAAARGFAPGNSEKSGPIPCLNLISEQKFSFLDAKVWAGR